MDYLKVHLINQVLIGVFFLIALLRTKIRVNFLLFFIHYKTSIIGCCVWRNLFYIKCTLMRVYKLSKCLDKITYKMKILTEKMKNLKFIIL